MNPDIDVRKDSYLVAELVLESWYAITSNSVPPLFPGMLIGANQEATEATVWQVGLSTSSVQMTVLCRCGLSHPLWVDGSGCVLFA